ncbi:MAG: HlyD family efflux transporter periplasmic adaptor subunit [Chitinophagaceae bacterium]|nr:HlyD family efflux transporter periplasmic adaptor subunit [Chitinophagaceae bacterium]
MPTQDERVALASYEQLRGEDYHEIISRKPTFLARWALVLFAIILFLIVAASWFIYYPETITAKAKLNSTNAPKEAIAHTDGKLITITVKEKEFVQAGQILAYIESLANPNAVDRINQQTDSIKYLMNTNKTNEIIYLFPNYTNQKFLNNLGELQTNYQTFIQSFITFKDFLNNGFYLRKKIMLQTDLQNLQKMGAVLVHQRELLQADLALTHETFKANETLAKEKVISSMDYRNEESKLIAKKLSLPQINASIINNESQQNDKLKEIAELDNQIAVQKSIFMQALQTLKSEIQAWEYKYVIKAPVAGSVAFTGFYQENQEIKNGQSLFVVQPTNTQYFLEAQILQYNFGKVKLGQQVLLKFEAYPYEQYGSVTGKIDFINTIPTDSGYLAKIILPDGLISNYKKPLQYHTGLTAQADIVTEDIRLLERFYYNIRKQLSR